jgi:hypothetical protein
MFLRFLKVYARRPLLVSAALFVVALGAAGAGVRLAVAPGTGGEAAEGPVNPRTLIGRAWLDKYPETSRDEIGLFIFFGSGFGVYEHGSRYRAETDFFEFERQGDAVEITFLHDRVRHKTRFGRLEARRRGACARRALTGRVGLTCSPAPGRPARGAGVRVGGGRRSRAAFGPQRVALFARERLHGAARLARSAVEEGVRPGLARELPAEEAPGRVGEQPEGDARRAGRGRAEGELA